MVHKIPIDNKELAVKILRRVSGMRREKKSCDFLIKVGKTKIPAHRNVLRATSDYFDAMFTHPTAESESGVVEMMDVNPECALICVDHMYVEEIFVSLENFEPLMFLANLMQLHTLREAIAAMLEAQLNPELFFIALRISRMYGMKKLEQTCNKYAEEHLAAVSKMVDFGELDESYIRRLVMSQNPEMSEEEKLDAVLIWINSSYSERSDVFSKVLDNIELSKIPLASRRYLMENEPRVNEDLQLYMKFTLSMLDTLNIGAKQIGRADPDLNALLVVFDKTSSYLHCFNPKTETWKQMQQLHDEFKQRRFTAVTCGDSIYVATSEKSLYRLKHSDETASWQRMADFQDNHGNFPPFVALSNQLYIIGGQGAPSSDSIEVFSPALNTWTRPGKKPQPSKKCAVVASDEHIYCFGGFLDGEHLDTAVRLDPTTWTWTSLAPMSETKRSMSAVHSGDAIFVIGGCRVYLDPEHLCTTERYDIVSNNWTVLRKTDTPRPLATALLFGNYIYAVGGGVSSDSIEKYDIEKDEWTMKRPPVEGLKIMGAVKILQPQTTFSTRH